MRGAGANAGTYPIFQAEALALLRRDLANAQFVREARAAASHVFESRYGLQPTHRLL